MIDFESAFGRAISQQLEAQYVIWLTTVDARLTPQPRPVWFIWQEDSFLIFSQAKAHKLKHIARHPRVALHFNTDERANKHIMIFTGEAILNDSVPAAHEIPAYMAKYNDGITALGSTPEEFSREYSVAIKIRPTEVRGWE
ncbi:MAG: TIGR03667 family PPOX class F420-dependent oxidoreductase [Chloroflexota bacterium]|nr:TIGR03667 family PPOX class F420-dependent oxidoreductase [Chloroflexota bacterium]